MTSKEISAINQLEFSPSVIAEDPSLVSCVCENLGIVSCVGVDCSFVSGAGAGPLSRGWCRWTNLLRVRCC